MFQYQFRVVPGGSRRLTYNLYPRLSGRLTLPRPRLTLYRDGAPVEAAELIDAALRHLPTHICVMVRRERGRERETERERERQREREREREREMREMRDVIIFDMRRHQVETFSDA